MNEDLDNSESKSIHKKLIEILSLIPQKIKTISTESWLLLVVAPLILTILSISHVLLVMNTWGVYGFSFDDSWIHVQYARTIFEGHPWEYAEGYPSTGSSGPLWSVVLVPIFLFGYEHNTVVTSVLIISSILYFFDVVLVGKIVQERADNWVIGIVGQVAFILVPRNAGLMLSGMETPLGMLMILLAIWMLPKQGWRYDLTLGVVAGLAYLCRPEFVLIAALCFPIRFILALKDREIDRYRMASIIGMFALAALVVLPWILHCFNTTGLPLPDSYYSKMRWGVSEEAVELWNHFWWKVWFPYEPYLITGFIGGVVLLFKKRPFLLAITTSLFALYRFTMPGMSLLFAARYLVPLFDLLAISAVCGIGILVKRIMELKEDTFKFSQLDVNVVSVLFILMIFYPSMGQYVFMVDHHANQTKNIEEMQVTLSLWIRENVPERSVIATYDVGAIGYFAEGTVIDLYGLVSPEILHNRTSLSNVTDYLKEMNCTYIMFYKQWFTAFHYNILAQGGSITILAEAHLDDNVVCGTDDMAVYGIEWN
ncbi:MAG: conserved membrane protein of unknown function [Candidatus Thorarchaeota archaeon]|nr:MAG: conserved membrane protein of unknown function [Candidatus Thorarchaeota archaeon]